MASFDDATIDVEIFYILICRRIPEEYTGKVVLVQFGTTIARTFNAHPKIRFDTPPIFEWSDARMGVDLPVMEVCAMEKSVRPVFGGEPGAI